MGYPSRELSKFVSVNIRGKLSPYRSIRHFGNEFRSQSTSILRWVLTIAAEGAIKKSGKLKRFHTRLNKHIGYSKAVVATARKLLIIIYHMLTKGEKFEERDDDLTHRKIRKMETKSKRMKRLKEKKTPLSEKHKKLMNKGMKMLINSESDANLG